nr:OmpA family protein [Vibrio crassostreae]
MISSACFGLVTGCSSAQEETTPIIYKNVVYSANDRVSNYFDDQYLIYSSLFSDFEVDRVAEREIRITVPTSYGYAVGKSTLNRDMRSRLATLSKTLNDYKETSIWVHGHTDSQGAYKPNLKLAQARANSVKRELLLNAVTPERVKTVSESFEVPKCTNDTKVGRDCNRRVEIYIRANTLKEPLFK